MLKPNVLILRTAGTNCDAETDAAFQVAGAETALVHIQQLISRKISLLDYQILAIPGGFSYGDDISAGILLATEMKHKLTDALHQFIDDGKLILGICNGFQVLVRAGLLPATEGNNPCKAGANITPLSGAIVSAPQSGVNTLTEMAQRATLAMNTSAKFECRWVHLETQQSPCIFTKNIKARVYLPVAHAEGRFTAPPEVLEQIVSNNQIVFRYGNGAQSALTITDKKNLPPQSGGDTLYPHNPNGSDANIAGICDTTGRIFGLMPHPERFLTKWNHPRWTREHLPEEGDGLAIFKNAVNYAKA